MARRNGYFRLLVLEDGTYIELFPPVDGGDPVSFDELQEYLIRRNHLLDKLAVAQAIKDSNGEKCTVKIDDTTGIYEAESYELKVSEDNMRLIARFYPCSNCAASLTIDEILKDLKFKKITYGIREDVIARYFADRNYCTDYLLAEGTRPVQGKDGKLDYYFNTDLSAKPKMNPDGTVDFFNLNLICPCVKDQILARITPADLGENGTTIYGETVKPHEVKQPSFSYGNGMHISEDGLNLISDTSGNVSLVDGKVFVSNVYEVSDVDTSTGNIEYDGDVRVLGSVRAGFCVQATGTIEVRGVVEAAMVQSDKDVIISRGMNGMGKGLIIAGNNVVAKFIENSRVQAEGYVQAEAILHSEVNSKGDVIVNGKKGFITGGSVKALGNVEAKIIGSTMGVDTDIEVGADPAIKIRLNDLTQKINDTNRKLNQIKPVLAALTLRLKKGDRLTDDQLRNLKMLSMEYKELNEDLEYLMNEQEAATPAGEVEDNHSCVKVYEYAYPGTQITISDVYTQLKKPVQHSRFIRDGADIRITAI